MFLLPNHPRLLSEVYQSNEDIHGLFFTIMYIAIPFFIIMLVLNVFKFTTAFPIWLSIFSQVIILGILDLVLYYRMNEVTWKKYRKNVHETVEKTLKDQTEQGQKTKSPMIANAYANVGKSGNFIVNLYDTVYETPEKVTKYFGSKGRVLFIFSIILLWAIYSTAYSQNPLAPWSILIWILSFLNFSFLAIAYAHLDTKHPEAMILLKDGTKITGRVTKFGKFAYVIKTGEEKLLTINADQISYIEEDLFNKTVDQATIS